ncbi:ABC transporter permease [Treponema primitia]|uniref:ABC transporter permease n=1 Tax=Treponema primitia TaxID=88058 RepID=UPI00397FD430
MTKSSVLIISKSKPIIWQKYGIHGANILAAAVLPVLLIISWQLAVDNGILNQSVFPGPRRIINALNQLIAKGTYSQHIFSSLGRVAQGFFWGSTGGLIVGTLAALFPWVNQSLIALIGILRPIPSVAYIPFWILWLGIGEESKIAVIIVGSFWPVLLNTIHGIKTTDPKLMELGQAFEKNYFQVLRKIIIPSAIPSIFTGLRLAVSSSWTAVVTAEMIAASRGIGFLIAYGRELAQPSLMFVGVITIGAIGLIIDTGVLTLQRKVIYWGPSGKE